jgi:hypothetical protein
MILRERYLPNCDDMLEQLDGLLRLSVHLVCTCKLMLRVESIRMVLRKLASYAETLSQLM